MCVVCRQERGTLDALRSRSLAQNSAPLAVVEEDAELVARAQLGDASAFATLYRRYANRIYDFAARKLDDRDAAEDVTQVVFMRMATSLHTCRDGAAFAGWLFAIARNVVVDTHHARRHTADPLDAAPDPEDPDPTPEEYAMRAERRDELRAARERCLTAGERELFDLLLADLNDKEIAAALGRGHGAVRTAHWRLLAKLRQCLGILIRQGEARHVAP
jgi:RNA polymerase sigma-70 factor (ECF subfamily)